MMLNNESHPVGDDWNQPINVPVSGGIDYAVTLTAKRTDARCKEAVCSTTAKLPPKPKPCCESLWLLRAFGAYGAAQGPDDNGFFRTADRELGAFKFDFNEGLGFGIELERLFAEPKGWRDAKWGWTLGLTQLNLDTIWVFDSPQHWIMDDDRVPMLALTTGFNYHFRKPAWDFFVGPVIGYAQFDDGTYADGTMMPGTFRAAFDDGFAYGANLGFDVFRGECWGFTGGLQYLKISTKADFLDVDVDPLIVKAGFVYHF